MNKTSEGTDMVVEAQGHWEEGLCPYCYNPLKAQSEPVAYRWRKVGFDNWTMSETKPIPQEGYEEEALYTQPAPADKDAALEEIERLKAELAEAKRELEIEMDRFNKANETIQRMLGTVTAQSLKAQSEPVGEVTQFGLVTWFVAMRGGTKLYTHPPADKDAERYRWHVKLYAERMGVPEEDVVKELDAAIDAAMKEGK